MRVRLLLLLAAMLAPAFEPFEIQVYDGTADGAGEAGVTRFWEPGADLQLQQGRCEGFKLGTRCVLPERSGLRLVLNGEIAFEPGGEPGFSASFDPAAPRWRS